jgi:outer membrane receptor protein involved in Fe transport
MNQRLLTSSIVMALYASTAFAQTADQTSADQDKKKQTLETVTVTGSLIPQSQIETASPTITISAQDISRQGFATVYDALKATPIANGGTQGNQSSGGFTQGAQTISLFGLPINYTLFLINGKQMTNYPLAYNGSNAFTDLSNIPVAMIDHIDIVPGGNSAIYGSAAIAGVVNIILKDKYDGVDIAYRYGDYSDGGGQNQRLQISGGHSWGNLDVSFGLEFINQKPIFASDRKQTASINANPSLNGAPAIPSRSFLILDGFTSDYIDPGAAACAPLKYLFNNTTSYATRINPGTGDAESYCGTTGQYQATSLLNRNRSGSAYTSLTYHINDTTEAYAQILFTKSAPQYNIGGSFQFWESNEQFLHPGTGYFWNPAENDLQLWQHIVAPEEYGGDTGAGSETIYTRNLNAALGLRGQLGADWNYDLYYNRSQANTVDSYRHFIKSAVDNYYLGPQMGTYYGYPVYTPDKNKLYTPLTPAVFNSLTARINNPSVAWNQNVNFTVTNPTLFHLPAGDAGVAATVQLGGDSLHNSIPALISSGDALGLTGSEAAGHRSNVGVGAELRIPVISTLTADVSGRYDNYSFAGTDAGKFTYKLGLEYRPIDTLLLRGNYATAFRAPDLVNVFGSNGFFSSGTDYYQCRLAGFGPGTYQNCNDYSDQFFGTNGSSKNLNDVTAKTLTYGAVYSPVDKLTFTVDYQRVEIKNEVTQLSTDQLLQDEADCLLGQTVGGATIDPNSPSCKLYESLVTRNAPDAKTNPNGLLTVTTYPINASSESENGLIAQANYLLDMNKYGTLGFNVNYYIEFQHLFQQFPGDPVINVYHDARFTDWKSTVNSSVTWNVGHWSTTLYQQRYGSIPNAGQTGTLAPWILYNGSIKYSFDSGAAIQVTANNLRNSKPPVDRTASTFPYYNTYNYNPYGRVVWVEFAYRFGASKE